MNYETFEDYMDGLAEQWGKVDDYLWGTIRAALNSENEISQIVKIPLDHFLQKDEKMLKGIDDDIRGIKDSEQNSVMNGLQALKEQGLNDTFFEQQDMVAQYQQNADKAMAEGYVEEREKGLKLKTNFWAEYGGRYNEVCRAIGKMLADVENARDIAWIDAQGAMLGDGKTQKLLKTFHNANEEGSSKAAMHLTEKWEFAEGEAKTVFLDSEEYTAQESRENALRGRMQQERPQGLKNIVGGIRGWDIMSSFMSYDIDDPTMLSNILQKAIPFDTPDLRNMLREFGKQLGQGTRDTGENLSEINEIGGIGDDNSFHILSPVMRAAALLKRGHKKSRGLVSGSPQHIKSNATKGQSTVYLKNGTIHSVGGRSFADTGEEKTAGWKMKQQNDKPQHSMREVGELSAIVTGKAEFHISPNAVNRGGLQGWSGFLPKELEPPTEPAPAPVTNNSTYHFNINNPVVRQEPDIEAIARSIVGQLIRAQELT